MGDENRIPKCEPETDPGRRETNKKLSTMSKKFKSKRKLKIPEGEKNDTLLELPNVDPMCVIAIIGVLIAGWSLYYTRMSVLGTQKKSNTKTRSPRSVEHEVHEVNEGQELQEFLGPVVTQQKQKKEGNFILFDD